MKTRTRLLLTLTAALLVAACLPLSSLAAENAAKGEVYGEGVGHGTAVKISQLFAEPEKWVGRMVRVEGTVTGVCAKRGCWITIGSDEEFQQMRIKVDDGVIVFPVEAKGRHAVAEGVFTKIELSVEQTRRHLQHQAEEKGEPFDPTSVTEPVVIYQIKGSGAVIKS